MHLYGAILWSKGIAATLRERSSCLIRIVAGCAIRSTQLLVVAIDNRPTDMVVYYQTDRPVGRFPIDVNGHWRPLLRAPSPRLPAQSSGNSMAYKIGLGFYKVRNTTPLRFLYSYNHITSTQYARLAQVFKDGTITHKTVVRSRQR